jgi:tyrosyl-tRNA synthetase
MLTFLPLSDIAALEADMAAPSYVPNTAQRRLAEEVTRFVHGAEGLEQAIKATQVGEPYASVCVCLGGGSACVFVIAGRAVTR